MPQCAIYTRVSKDQSGDSRSPAQQEAELRGVAERLGWTVARVYCDAGVSASAYARRSREQYEQLLADLDQFDAVAVWDLDRLTRDLGTFAKVRDRLAASGVLLADRSGVIDLAGRDAVSSGVRALIAEDESRKSSSRLRRATAAGAAEGRPHGKIPFGYDRYLRGDPPRPAWRPHDEHADTVRWLFAGYAAGESIRSLAGDLDLDPRTVARWLDNPAYVAQRVHRGKVIGPADWPPLVDDETWTAVCARRAATRGGASRPSGVKHVLSGVVLCGACGTRLRVLVNRKTYAHYCCPARGCHKVSRSAAALEAFVLGVVAEVIRRDADRLLAPADTAAAQRLGSERAALVARAEALAELVATGELDPGAYAKATRAVEARLTELDDQRLDLAPTSPLLRPVVAAQDVGAALAALPVPQRREVVETVLRGPVRVMPTARRNGAVAFDDSAILFPWDGDDDA